MLPPYWHSSQIYRRNEFVLVTESTCGESDGLVLLLGSASNFNCEYLLSPYVRMVIIYVCMYIYIFVVAVFLQVFMVCFVSEFFVGVLQVKSKFTGNCDRYTSQNNASCTRVTTLLYTVDSHSFFTGYSIFFVWQPQSQLLELV